ncbi:MAG: molybdopterin-binding protein [Thermodesulfovibrio sp.]|nr:molybdopterin-binding protein [Thermodesulfovibrio sp.]
MLDKKYLSPEDAIKLILKHIPYRCLPSEIVPIEEAYSRVTAEDIISPEDLPGFNRSTVDGFAVRASDTFGAKEGSPAYLKLKGDIPMGAIPPFSLSNGESASIATGGMLPEGADAVVMLEHVNVISDDLIEVLKAVSPGENVIFFDEDAKKGELIIKAGYRLKPQDIGALAGLGIKEVKVIKRPVISIILTGDEIIPHTEKVTLGKVRDVNSFSIAGLCYENGAVPLKMGIFKDDYNDIKEAVKKAYELSDLVLITGGTSAGTKDLTAKIIDETGLPGVIFHGASIKPGKPIIGGVCNGKPIFGLPGHPVAVYICFELFVKPVIHHMMGVVDKSFKKTVKAKMSRSVHSQAGRQDFIRVSLEERDGQLWATPLISKSGLIMSLVKAHGIVHIPSDLLGISEGEEVLVEIID